MAANKQTLELELQVKSEGFKAKLLEAQRNLLQLEQKSLKAGGASEIMAKKITKAKVAVKMARNEYNQATNALKLHAIQATKTAGATVKLGRSQKRSNMAMTQAAYALDDMQYGFQGVQNNIQAMAVSMGASGPIIMGLTLLVVTIGFVVKQFQKAQKEALAVQKALGEKQGLIATTLRHAQVLKTTEKGTKEYTESLKALKANGFDKAKMSVDEYTEALIRQKVVEAKLAANADKIKELLVQRIKAEEKLRRVTDNPIKASAMGAGVGQAGMSVQQLKAANAAAVTNAQGALDKINLKLKESVQIGGDLQAILNSTKVTGANDDTKATKDGEKDGVLYSHGFLKAVSGADITKMYGQQLTDGIKHSLELMKAQGSSKEQLLNAELKQLEAADLGIYSLEKQEEILHRIAVLKAQIANLPTMQDSGVGLNADDVKFEKFKSDLEEVQQLMLNGVITFDEYIRRVENLSLAFDKVTEKKQQTSEMDKILNDGIGNLITGFAQAAGSGENIGAALLGGIGNTLMQLGGLLITTGLGVEAFKASLATLNGPVAIAAGIAMVAAGAAFSSAAKKAGGGGGGGSSSGRRSNTPRSTVRPNPVRENARVRNSNLIIPMDRMRYGMQGADDNYSGFN